MNKKIIFFALFFLLIILIFLNILIKLILSKKESVLTERDKTLSPTIYQRQNYSLDKKSSLSLDNSSIDKKNILTKIKPLPPDEVNKLQTIKKLLPLETDEFKIDYSYFLDAFIIHKKTADAEEKFSQWAKENNLEDLIKNKNLFVFTDKPIEEYEKEVETILVNNKEISLLKILPSPTTVIDSSSNDKESAQTDSNQQIKLLVDLLKILFSFNYQSTSTQSALSVPSPFITQPVTPINYPSLPTSLKDIFNEVGQKVGVPPKILEAVMKIEMPSTFNLTPAEIAKYSAPGNYWPKCGPNECSATGPMQMTTGIDKHGSSACSSCCWQGRCQAKCPNAWLSYGNAVITYGGYSHQPNPCNIKDNVYGAAAKLKNDSGAHHPLNWTQEQVFQAARRYYGNCTVTYTRLGNRTYCQYVWDYYQ